jgi:hypothetical protein
MGLSAQEVIMLVGVGAAGVVSLAVTLAPLVIAVVLWMRVQRLYARWRLSSKDARERHPEEARNTRRRVSLAWEPLADSAVQQ